MILLAGGWMDGPGVFVSACLLLGGSSPSSSQSQQQSPGRLDLARQDWGSVQPERVLLFGGGESEGRTLKEGNVAEVLKDLNIKKGEGQGAANGTATRFSSTWSR